LTQVAITSAAAAAAATKTIIIIITIVTKFGLNAECNVLNQSGTKGHCSD